MCGRINVMLRKLHVSSESDLDFVPEEGQRDLACSNKKSLRCPSFGMNSNEMAEDAALDYFSSILVEAFLDQEYERNNLHKPKESGDICPGIDQRAS
jgi:hypothetical protein